MTQILIPRKKLLEDSILRFLKRKATPVNFNSFEFLNNIKILSGINALELIPRELASRGINHPMLITYKEHMDLGMQNSLKRSLSEAGLAFGDVFLCNRPVSVKCMEQAASDFAANHCDAVITMGDEALLASGKQSVKGTDKLCPVIHIPTGFHGIETSGDADLLVLDPKMTLSAGPGEMISSAIGSLCRAAEAYTSQHKNPLTDAFAISSIGLVKNNLELVLKNGRNLKARSALANAAFLSSLSLNGSSMGAVHAVSLGITRFCRVSYHDAATIIFPNYMSYHLIRFDKYYGELLLHLAGPEIYADTASHERGRKFIQTIRNLILDKKTRAAMPICLSEIGLKRSDLNTVAELIVKNDPDLFDKAGLTEEDISNILNLSF